MKFISNANVKVKGYSKKALKEILESFLDTTVLKMYGDSDGITLVEYDGITVTKWHITDVDKFLYNPSIKYMSIVEEL